MIDYGDRLRIGVILPSGNVVAEPQIRAMTPPGTAFYVTRLPLRGSSEAELMRMMDGIEDAALLLADADVDLIVFHCTAVTTFTPKLGAEIRARIEAATGIPGAVTSDALASAFRVLDLRRIALLSPYIPEVHQREIAFVRELGLEVTSDAALGVNSNAQMGGLSPETLLTWVLDHQDPQADGYFLSCTAIRTAELIDTLEDQLDRPVVTSNQAMVWHALSRAGAEEVPAGFGKLMWL